MGVPDLCARWRAINALQVAVGAGSSRCPAVAPDSPVNYSGAAFANSRDWRVPEPRLYGAPDTVRCTPDSPVNFSALALDFPEGDEFELKSSGQFNHQNYLGTRCKPNSLSISPFLVIDANTNQSKCKSA
jgi:hypothetical protein